MFNVVLGISIWTIHIIYRIIPTECSNTPSRSMKRGEKAPWMQTVASVIFFLLEGPPSVPPPEDEKRSPMTPMTLSKSILAFVRSFVGNLLTYHVQYMYHITSAYYLRIARHLVRRKLQFRWESYKSQYSPLPPQIRLSQYQGGCQY